MGHIRNESSWTRLKNLRMVGRNEECNAQTTQDMVSLATIEISPDNRMKQHEQKRKKIWVIVWEWIMGSCVHSVFFCEK